MAASRERRKRQRHPAGNAPAAVGQDPSLPLDDAEVGSEPSALPALPPNLEELVILALRRLTKRTRQATTTYAQLREVISASEAAGSLVDGTFEAAMRRLTDARVIEHRVVGSGCLIRLGPGVGANA